MAAAITLVVGLGFDLALASPPITRPAPAGDQAVTLNELRPTNALDSPPPSFWARHRMIFNSLKIVLVVIAISYVIKLVVWLIRQCLAYLAARASRIRFSAKRAGTMLSFAGSIIKLFVWVFGAVAVLNELGIDTAKSTGAIGAPSD
jgi:small-conductance mechanosensitive channel